MTDPIICYFDFASAHTYLGLQQLKDVATKYDRVVDWRPVSVMDLWKAHDYMPIGNPIAKGRYIKKDFIRTAGLLGLPLNIPPSFPSPDLSAARHLVWHVRLSDPAKANAMAFNLMQAYWAKGRDIEKPDVLAEVAAEAGAGTAEVAAAATDADAAKACADETAAAAEIGVFGAPHMLVDGEPFWGHDRIRYIDMWLEKQAAGN